MLCWIISGRESDYRDRVLKPDGQEILMLAISSLEAAVGSLKDGTIEFQMLIILKEHSDRFLALCEHITKEEGKLSLLRQLLHQRCIELTAFQEERDKVSVFIRMCSLIKQGNKKNYSSFGTKLDKAEGFVICNQSSHSCSFSES